MAVVGTDLGVGVLVPILESARSAITRAEAGLETAIGEVQAARRSEKITISEALEKAFEELRNAKSELARLEGLLADE